MNLRKSFVAAAVLLALTLSSCGTMRRAGKDLGIVVASPILIPYAGFADGFTDAKNVGEGLGPGATPTYEVLVIPFSTAWGLIKHTFFVALHAVDFVAFPIYGAAELYPYGPEIEPLDYYSGTPFDREPDEKSGTDAETGEQIDK